MVTSCHEWICDRAFQADPLLNKVFQAETTANLRHEPNLTPRQIRNVALRFVHKQVCAP